MPSLFRSAAAAALVGVAIANPLPSPSGDACLAVVTGKAALGDDNIRKEHCSSFIKTIVTPSAVTVTTTITQAPDAQSSAWGNWKRDVTVCPNEVPNYASACDESAYKSACSVWGVTGETTYTIPATTTTKTVYVNGGSGSGNNGNGSGTGKGGICTATSTISVTKTGCSGGVTTSTVTSTATTTVTKDAITVTVTGDHPIGTGVTGKCLSDDKAQEFVTAFTDLLEHTNYNGTQGPPGSGYHYNVSAKYLAEDFADYSDSINWMAGFPLGGVTFASRAAFDYGQGTLQPELKMTTKFVAHSCKEITWKWNALTPSNATVMGINHMILSDDLSQIKVNHAEFDNAAWLASFGLQCKVPR